MRGLQRSFHLFRFRYVFGNSVYTYDFTVFSVEWHLARERPGLAAVRPAQVLELADRRNARAHDIPLVVPRMPGMTFSEQIKIRFSDEVIWILKAMPLCFRFAYGNKTRLGVFEINNIARVIQKHVQNFLRELLIEYEGSI